MIDKQIYQKQTKPMQSPIKTQRDTNHNDTSYLSIQNTSRYGTIKSKNPNFSTSIMMRKGSNRSLEKMKIQEKDRGQVVAKLDFSITQRNYHDRCKTQRIGNQYYSLQKNRQDIKLKTERSISKNPQRKQPTFQISKKSIQIVFKDTQTKRSSKRNEQIQAYGISSSKGYGNTVNTHQIGVYLGKIKHLMLIQGFNGTFAASFVKTELPLQFIRRSKINEAKRSIEDNGKAISLVCKTVQKRLIEEQQKINDTSGCSVINVLIDNDTITVGNCGVSQTYCFTQMKNLIKMNQIHDTQNSQQVQRIVGMGTRLYRTVLNTPYKKDMQLCSPVRIFPSGLTYTRSLGYPASAEQHGQAIISTQQVRYLALNDVQWCLIASSSVHSNINQTEIQTIVQEEIKKLSMTYTFHDIAQQASKRIIFESISKGSKGSMTAMLIFVGLKQFEGDKQFNKIKGYGEAQQLKKNSNQKSLKYIGDRKSFFKQRQ